MRSWCSCEWRLFAALSSGHASARYPGRLGTGSVYRCLAAILALLATGGMSSMAAADEEPAGQADLDEAIVARIDATTLDDLEHVSVLLESAISKGLDEENTAFARQMLGAVSFQQAQEAIGRMRVPGGPGPEVLRKEALEYLKKAVDNDKTLGDAYLLMARLNALPGGDVKQAREAIDHAIKQLEDDAGKLSDAYVLSAILHKKPDDQMDHLDKAIEVFPNNPKAIQMRALFRLKKGDIKEGLADFLKAVELEPQNRNVILEIEKIVDTIDEFDEVKTRVSELLRKSPSADLYRLRALISQREEEYDDAITDLSKALAINPQDWMALLRRARNFLLNEDLTKAKSDVNQLLTLQPQSIGGIDLRSGIALQEGRTADAINDMLILVKSLPNENSLAVRLALLYQVDDRPRKAIQIATEVINRDPKNWNAWRIRGDARLSISEHEEALGDFEKALLHCPKDSVGRTGVLNNFAWVLATSPIDSVRNPNKALELAKEAGELTEYKQAHILSTLAAAHAEKGDFEVAIKWATKAVEIGRQEKDEQLEQLEDELEAYRQNKPWREKQKTEENTVPILAPEEIIDT